jgi:hypothetical protein
MAIGFAGGSLYHPQQQVQAQMVAPVTPNIQDVTPGVTIGSLGSNLILAHEIAADRLTVNGYDVMLLQQNILSYLGNRPLAERADIQNIVNASRASTVYRIKQPQVPSTGGTVIK